MGDFRIEIRINEMNEVKAKRKFKHIVRIFHEIYEKAMNKYDDINYETDYLGISDDVGDYYWGKGPMELIMSQHNFRDVVLSRPGLHELFGFNTRSVELNYRKSDEVELLNKGVFQEIILRMINELKDDIVEIYVGYGYIDVDGEMSYYYCKDFDTFYKATVNGRWKYDLDEDAKKQLKKKLKEAQMLSDDGSIFFINRKPNIDVYSYLKDNFLQFHEVFGNFDRYYYEFVEKRLKYFLDKASKDKLKNFLDDLGYLQVNGTLKLSLNDFSYSFIFLKNLKENFAEFFYNGDFELFYEEIIIGKYKYYLDEDTLSKLKKELKEFGVIYMEGKKEVISPYYNDLGNFKLLKFLEENYFRFYFKNSFEAFYGYHVNYYLKYKLDEVAKEQLKNKLKELNLIKEDGSVESDYSIIDKYLEDNFSQFRKNKKK